ncbi:MAG: hypothetical protein NC218_06900 [Acetobacter sp.]|nr:hypothetical protein [Acetobacter sp.]
MAEENKIIDEKKLSEPFEKLNNLPSENITNEHKAEAVKLFSQIVENVMNGHSVSIAEYNTLSRIHKVYEFNSILKGLETDKQQAFAAELKTVGDRKVKTTALNNFVKPIRTTNNQDLKKELNERIATLNTALKNTDGNFTAEQVKQLQDFLEPYKTNDKIKINVDKLFTDVIKPERGQSTANPAFTALYNQIAPKPAEPQQQTAEQKPLDNNEVVNTLAAALQNVGTVLARTDKINQLAPAERLIVTKMSEGIKEEHIDTLLDLALQTKQENTNNTNFANTLVDKATQNGGFFKDELREMQEVISSIESIKANYAKTELQPLLDKGTSKLDEADIEKLRGLAWAGIEVDKINAVLTEYQTLQATPTQTPQAQNPQQPTPEQPTPTQTPQAQTPQKPTSEPTQPTSSSPVQPAPTPEITVTEDEINKYMEEIRNSETLNTYLASVNTLRPSAIEAAMNIGIKCATIKDDNGNDIVVKDEEGKPMQYISDKDRAIAFGSPMNILQAYKYYANDTEKLAELDNVVKAYLQDPENKPTPETSPDRAYGILALASKIQDKDSALYEQTTRDLALNLKKYDIEKFGNKSDEELAKNFEDLKKTLETIPSDDIAKMMAKYTFTDDKGKNLTGDELNEAQKDVLDLARLLTAQDLVKYGVPEDKTLLLNRMEEIIRDEILGKGVSEEIKQAAKDLTAHQKSEYTASIKNKTALLTKKDKKTLELAADLLAAKALKLPPNPSEEDKKKLEEKKNEFLNKLTQGNKKLIQSAAIALTKNDGKFFNTEEENLKLLCSGDDNTIQMVAKLQASKEAGFSEPSTTKQKIEYETLTKQKEQKLKTAIASQTTFSKSELVGQLAGTMVHAETFTKRIKQQGNKNKLFNKAHSWLKQIDARLTERYGKKYTNAKKVTKTLAQIGLGIAKSTVCMAAASACGPAGVAAYMTYLTVKQGKETFKKLKDPNLTSWEKVTHAIGGAASVALTAGGIGGALGQVMGENAPAFMQNFSNLTSQIPTAGRIAAMTAVNAMPNGVKGFILKKKLNAINKQIKAEKDPKKLNKLMESQAKLYNAQRANLVDAGTKVASGVIAGSVMSLDCVQELRSNITNSLQATSSSALAATGITDTQHTTNVFDKANPLSPQYNASAYGFGFDLENSGDTAAQQTEAENLYGQPDDVHGRKAPLTEEAKAANLAAAEEKGSGHLGKSDIESMQTDMARETAKLGLTAEQTSETIKALAQNYGTNSYEAMHAALAEPNALAAAMGIEGKFTSAEMLNHLVTHPELANNEGFKAYVAEHFDEQDRFHSSHITTHTTTTHIENAPRVTPPAPEQPRPSALPEELRNAPSVSVDDLYGRNHPQPQQHPQTIEHTVHTDVGAHIPLHGIAVNGNIAYVDGQSYRQSMEFSDKLGYTLNDRAIIGVYQNNQHPNDYVMITAPLDHHGNIIPDGRLTANHHTYEYLRDAKNFGHTGYTNEEYKMRSVYGTGGICTYNIPGNTSYSTINKVSIGMDVVADVAHTAGYITDIAGGKGDTLHRVGGGLSGAAHITRDIGILTQVLGAGKGNQNS